MLDSSACGSTTTFVERGQGDVLLAKKNETYLSIKELGPDMFELITPSISISYSAKARKMFECTLLCQPRANLARVVVSSSTASRAPPRRIGRASTKH